MPHIKVKEVTSNGIIEYIEHRPYHKPYNRNEQKKETQKEIEICMLETICNTSQIPDYTNQLQSDPIYHC